MKLKLLILTTMLAAGFGQPVTAQDTAKPASEATEAANAASTDKPTEAELMRGFKGKIELDVRDSKTDWTPFLPKEAPKGAPNILFILYDDTGQAAWSPYGGRIHMPTLDKLAADGLTYTQWHTTALCAPVQSANWPDVAN